MDSHIKLLTSTKVELSNLLKNHGETSVLDYFRQVQSTSQKPMTVEPDYLLMGLRKLLPESVYELAHKQLSTTSLIHTADHQGMLNHSFFWNSKAAFFEALPINKKVLVVLSSGNVSPTNSSHPKSLFWHDEHAIEHHANIISRKFRQRSMYGIRALNKEELITWTKKLPKKLFQCFDKIISENPQLFLCTWLDEQLLIINYFWWREVFGDEHLVYLEVESVVSDFIVREFSNPTATTNKILFDKITRIQYLAHFTGITGAHTAHSGSELFWYIDPMTHKRLRVVVENNYLIASNGVKIALNKKAIEKNLKHKTLMPTTALSYGILMYCFGLTLSGGFSQIDYLAKISKAWRDTFNDYSYTQPTNIFVGEISLFSIIHQDITTNADLADVYLRTSSMNERLSLRNTAVRKSTMTKAIGSALHDIMKITHPDILVPEYTAEIRIHAENFS